MSYQRHKPVRRKQRSFPWKPIVIFAIVGLLVFFGFLLLQRSSDDRDSVSQPTTTPASQSAGPMINLEPPTEDEQAVGTEQKEINQAKDEDRQPVLADGANIVIVDASQYGDTIEVRSFVSNVVENGSCEIVFTQGEQSISKTVNAFADASSTPCLTLTMQRSELPTNGEWTVTITYKNDTIMGSASRAILIE